MSVFVFSSRTPPTTPLCHASLLISFLPPQVLQHTSVHLSVGVIRCSRRAARTLEQDSRSGNAAISQEVTSSICCPSVAGSHGHAHPAALHSGFHALRDGRGRSKGRRAREERDVRRLLPGAESGGRPDKPAEPRVEVTHLCISHTHTHTL